MIISQFGQKIPIYRSVLYCFSVIGVCYIKIIMSSVKKKSEKLNSELTVMQMFSKALTGGSEWYDKVNLTIFA